MLNELIIGNVREIWIRPRSRRTSVARLVTDATGAVLPGVTVSAVRAD